MGAIMELIVHVVHCKKYEGDDAIYVGRPSPLGNPFTVKQHGHGTAIDLYKQWLNLQYSTNNRRVIDELDRLAYMLKKDGEIVLSCWCAPKPCHADLIAQAITKLATQS